MQFILEPLPYAYNALEPFIDQETMRIHHDKHHQAYTDKFNAAIKDLHGLEGKSAEEIVSKWSSFPDGVKNAVRNNGGGFINHNFFWKILKKDEKLQGKIAEAIVKRFGSFENFKKEFSDAAINRFGSGWAWLVLDKGKLEIVSTANQDTPLSEGKIPLLTIDVWEHAYYLKYKNVRPEYVNAFFSVINWKEVEKNYIRAMNIKQ